MCSSSLPLHWLTAHRYSIRPAIIWKKCRPAPSALVVLVAEYHHYYQNVLSFSFSCLKVASLIWWSSTAHTLIREWDEETVQQQQLQTVPNRSQLVVVGASSSPSPQHRFPPPFTASETQRLQRPPPATQQAVFSLCCSGASSLPHFSGRHYCCWSEWWGAPYQCVHRQVAASYRPTSQPTNQPASQPTNQPTNYPVSYHPAVIHLSSQSASQRTVTIIQMYINVFASGHFCFLPPPTQQQQQL